MKTLTSRTWTLCALAFAAATGIIVALSPADQQLGPVVRLLYFHGAATWVNLGVFTLAAVAGGLFVVRGTESWYGWARALRYVAVVLWIANTLMGVESMRRVWGGVLWTEPRLRMTFWILIASFVVVAVELAVGNKRLSGALDVGLAVLLWSLILTTPNLFHPESPVLNSSATIIAFFVAMAATTFGSVICVTRLLKDRLDSRAAG